MMLALATAVLAQVAAPPAADLPPIQGVVWESVITVVGAVLSVLMALIGRAVAGASKANRYGSIMAQLWNMVQAVVAHAETEIRPELVKDIRTDGSLTPEAAAKIKNQVVGILRTTSADQLQDLVKSFGLPPGAVDTLLSGLVERAVTILKTTPIPTAPPPLADVVAAAGPAALTPLSGPSPSLGGP